MPVRLADIFSRVAGPDANIEFVAYDGSRSGPAGAPVRLELRSPIGLSHIASAPGELGFARAYVSGALEVHGDMHTALTTLMNLPIDGVADIPGEVRGSLFTKAIAARLWWPVKRPPQEHRQHGKRHSKRRDSSAISHHYDVSNRFYEYVLGPSMAYTCAVYPRENASLEEAQYAKFDLVARKIGLRPGMRLLDIGCGWGGMVMHAAQHYGVKALGVTLSKQQAEWAQRAIEKRGLSELAEVRHSDYRDVTEGNFDALSSIGLTEHIGEDHLPGYFQFIHDKLRPGARVLNHCITRANDHFEAKVGGFINRYVFPDGELEGPGKLMSVMTNTGFEVRHEENLREHYAMTLRDWCRNLDDNWDAAVAEVGIGTARVWRLYMAASRVGFDRNQIQLHQMLGVKLDGARSGMSLRPDWEPAAETVS